MLLFVSGGSLSSQWCLHFTLEDTTQFLHCSQCSGACRIYTDASLRWCDGEELPPPHLFSPPSTGFRRGGVLEIGHMLRCQEIGSPSWFQKQPRQRQISRSLGPCRIQELYLIVLILTYVYNNMRQKLLCISVAVPKSWTLDNKCLKCLPLT